MDTPIRDFVRRYAQSGGARLHMPGHKGAGPLGVEPLDITEIAGADALYEAEGIIARSEANASGLFGSAATFYSAEGSSLCVRAMLDLARLNADPAERPVVVSARNAHRSFLTAAALLDLDVRWLWPEGEDFSLCRCPITPGQLRRALEELPTAPIAVYVTSPDYLGGELDIAALSQVAHAAGVPLLVDNAHGAYLHFLPSPRHPMDLGADLCCDSAHKTLPVLTGGAYLHVHPAAPACFRENARQAMALFGSTSPSYLILQSLDCANAALSGDWPRRLAERAEALDRLRLSLRRQGWTVEDTDPLKLTVAAAQSGWEGPELSAALRRANIECEYADPDHLVLMFTPENPAADLRLLEDVMGRLTPRPALVRPRLSLSPPERRCSIRQAALSPRETIPVEMSVRRILADAAVSCPPAIPPVACGEIIADDALRVFRYYGVKQVSVLREDAVSSL